MPIDNLDALTRSNLIDNLLSEVNDLAEKEDHDMGIEDNMGNEISVDEPPPGVVAMGADKSPDILR